MLSPTRTFRYVILAMACTAIFGVNAQTPKPAITQDVDQAARNAASFACSANFIVSPGNGGAPYTFTCPLGTVPAGKVFVVETFNATISGPVGMGNIADVAILQNGVGQNFIAGPFQTGGLQETLAMLASAKAYVQPSTALVVVVASKPNVIGAYMMAARTHGYFVTQ